MTDEEKWSIKWNKNCHWKSKYLKKTILSATLFTTNPSLTDLGLNPHHSSEKMGTNHFKFGSELNSSNHSPHLTCT
jgi:hypothetical protein